MPVKTVNSTHKAVMEALEALEQRELERDEYRKHRDYSMLDIVGARVTQAEKKVVSATKDFIHHLSEACIKF